MVREFFDFLISENLQMIAISPKHMFACQLASLWHDIHKTIHVSRYNLMPKGYFKLNKNQTKDDRV